MMPAIPPTLIVELFGVDIVTSLIKPQPSIIALLISFPAIPPPCKADEDNTVP